MGGEEVPPVGRRAAIGRTDARSLLHRDGVLRAGERDLRHRAVPGALPGRVPLYRSSFDRAAIRRVRGGHWPRAGPPGFLSTKDTQEAETTKNTTHTKTTRANSFASFVSFVVSCSCNVAHSIADVAPPQRPDRE